MWAIRGRIVALSSDPTVAPNEAAVFTGRIWVGDDGTIVAVTRSSQAGPPGSDGAVPHPSSRDAARLITEWRAAVADLRTVVTPDPGGDNAGPNYGDKFAESGYAPIPRGDLPFGVPSWLGDDSRGRQSRPKRRNTVERDPADLLHTLIWRAPAG